MERFDPATSFGYEVSKGYDADDTGIAGQRAALEFAPAGATSVATSGRSRRP